MMICIFGATVVDWPDAPDDPEGEDDETEDKPREYEKAEQDAGARLEGGVLAQLRTLQQNIAHVVH